MPTNKASIVPGGIEIVVISQGAYWPKLASIVPGGIEMLGTPLIRLREVVLQSYRVELKLLIVPTADHYFTASIVPGGIEICYRPTLARAPGQLQSYRVELKFARRWPGARA